MEWHLYDGLSELTDMGTREGSSDHLTADGAWGVDLAPGSPALLDARGAGRLLNVPASWVAAEARAGRIPHVRLGRYVRFEPEALRDWWRERRRGPWRDSRNGA
jgi:excisionase family DNA binding protein